MEPMVQPPMGQQFEKLAFAVHTFIGELLTREGM